MHTENNVQCEDKREVARNVIFLPSMVLKEEKASSIMLLLRDSVYTIISSSKITVTFKFFFL